MVYVSYSKCKRTMKIPKRSYLQGNIAEVPYRSIILCFFLLCLGLTLDQQLTFAPHINRLCRDCYYQLRQLRVISRSLTSTATATLVHAFVTSRLDYCST